MRPQNNNSFKIIQITDTHLFATNTILDGVDTNLSFSKVIERFKNEELHDTNAIYLTGDLSQDESKKSYEIIVDSLKGIDIPIFWIPGNHDSVENMKHTFNSDHFTRGRLFHSNHWEFIFLNTKKDGINEGFLSEEEINFLKNALINCDARKSIAVVMHHHPAAVGTPFIDKYMLINREDFWSAVDEKINLVICGHVHGDYCIRYKNIVIESSPATCVQWKINALKRDSEKKIGYKIYHFKEGSYVANSKIWDG